jgi:hypothetical protein
LKKKNIYQFEFNFFFIDFSKKIKEENEKEYDEFEEKLK